MKVKVLFFVVVFQFILGTFAVDFQTALDVDSLTFTSGGDAPWLAQTSVSYDGIDAVQSGNVDDGDESYISTMVDGPVGVSFKWKVASESGFDYLNFIVNGEVIQSISGDSGWNDFSYVVPNEGYVTLTWSYTKDGSVSDLSDCGWVDQLVVNPATNLPPHIYYEPQTKAAELNGTVELLVAAYGENLGYQWYEGVSGDMTAPVTGANSAMFTTLPVLVDVMYWVSVSNSYGVAFSQAAEVLIAHEVYSLNDLQKVGSGVDGWELDDAYVVMNDIDATATAGWSYEVVLEGDHYNPDNGWSWEYILVTNMVSGFKPIGSTAMPFTGVFDGAGHIVRNLNIDYTGIDNGPENAYFYDLPEAGLFGATGIDAVIQNLGMVNSLICGYNNCGGLVGYNSGRVSQCFSIGTVEGRNDVGGLVGFNWRGDEWLGETGVGSVYDCYSIGCVKGDYDDGSLIGYNRGEVVNSLAYLALPYAGRDDIDFSGYDSWTSEIRNCCQPAAGCSLAEEENGVFSRSTAELQQQTTYMSWDFNNVWAVQEGRGTAYLGQFAEGKDCHNLIAPAVTVPGNQNSVDSIVPVFTGSVDTASCDFVNAIWQVSASSDFSDAQTWMGCESNSYDNVLLKPVFSSKLPFRDALDYNSTYYVRVALQTEYGAWTGWSASNMFAVQKSTDPMIAGKQNLEVFMGAAYLDGVLLADKLHDAAGDFSTAVSLDGADYEARIFSAVTAILELADNSEFRDLIAEFGYTFGDTLCGTITGALDMASAPLPNECVDRIAAQCAPVLAGSLADLEVIPTNWTGAVELKSEEFAIDETVFIDIADVLYLRAILGASQAVLSLAEANDLTFDYANTNFYVQQQATTVAEITVDGSGSEWTEVPNAFESEEYQVEAVKIARSNDMVYLYFKLAEDVPLTYINASVELSNEYNTDSEYAWFENLNEQNAQTNEWNGHVVHYIGSEVEIAMDVSWFAGGGPFDVELDGYTVGADFWVSGSSDSGLKPVNDILAEHPDLMGAVRNTARLELSRLQLSNAVEVVQWADRAVNGRTDSLMHFIEYDPAYSNDQDEVNGYVTDVQTSLNAPHSITVSNYTENIYLGAVFEAPYVLRGLLPRLTDDNEIIDGSIPDPAVGGILPDGTQQRWYDELYGRVPMVQEDVFAINGQLFSTGGYAYWDQKPDEANVTNIVQSGIMTNTLADVSWLETTFEGPGTLNFSWANTNIVAQNNFLCLYVDGIRQYGAIRDNNTWGPRQVILGDGVHTVRWAYIRAGDRGFDSDGGLIGNLNWVESAELFTSTPTPVPYSWLDQFNGLVVAGAYEQAALGDQDNDGMLTWQEFVAGTIPNDRNSRFLATIESTGSDLLIGWHPDLSPSRLYQVEGKADLPAGWAPTNSASRFFRVKVSMP